MYSYVNLDADLIHSFDQGMPLKYLRLLKVLINNCMVIALKVY